MGVRPSSKRAEQDFVLLGVQQQLRGRLRDGGGQAADSERGWGGRAVSDFSPELEISN